MVLVAQPILRYLRVGAAADNLVYLRQPHTADFQPDFAERVDLLTLEHTALSFAYGLTLMIADYRSLVYNTGITAG